MNDNIALCPKCKENYYVIIDQKSVKEGTIELRQCNICFRRYRVLVGINGIEENI